MATLLATIKSWMGAASTWLAPLIKPITDLLSWVWEKGYVLIIAFMAKRAGKKQAYSDSMKETLKDVNKIKHDRNDDDLRKRVRDKYSR